MDPVPATCAVNSGEMRVDVEFSGEEERETTTISLLSKPCLSGDLHRFRACLKWCGLDHSSCAARAFSYAVFLSLTFAVPATRALCVREPRAAAAGVAFDKLAQLPASALATIAFLTLAAFFRRHSVRHLLFLDGLGEDSAFVRLGYARDLDRAFRCLAYILLPSFAVELAHKILFFSTVAVRFPAAGRVPANSILFVATLAAWVYRTGVFLLVCVLFRLTCELQILRLEGFRRALEGSSPAGVDTGGGCTAGALFREHIRIKEQLLVTSHRYRIFILGCLVTITFSQLGALMVVLASKSEKNFFNSGDLVVCSVVQLSGFFMCLIGAARITHRAQGMVALASRWHVLITCASDAADANAASQTLNLKALKAEVADQFRPPAACLFSPEATLSFHARDALVTYLYHNKGGITLFGFSLDRGLLHTLFVFEMSLVLWILSKVVVIS